MRMRISICLVVLTACGGGDGGDAGEADGGARDGGGPRFDGGDATGLDARDVGDCHWDCFFARACLDGRVIQTVHAPVDCDRWTGSCPTFVAGECSEGCSDRPPHSGYGWPPGSSDRTWTAWCEEGELARVGDACTSEEECEPPAPDVDGGADHLGCVAGACAPAAAPVLPSDVYAPCTIDVEAVATPARQVVEDTGCESGWCELQRDTLAGCVRHACAAPCEGDWDCPDRCFFDFTPVGSCIRRELSCH